MLFFSKIGLVTALGERILLVKILFIYVRIFKGYCPYETKLTNQIAAISIEMRLKTELRRKQKNWMVVYVCSVAKKWLLIISMAAKMII